MGPTWLLSAPDGPHVGPMNLAIRVHSYGWSSTSYDTKKRKRKCAMWLYINWWYNYMKSMHNKTVCIIDGTCSSCFNISASGRCKSYFQCVASDHVLWVKFMRNFCEIYLRWMPKITWDDKPTLAQFMAWCREATKLYLTECWSKSLSPYGAMGPQWVTSTPRVTIKRSTQLSLCHWS